MGRRAVEALRSRTAYELALIEVDAVRAQALRNDGFQPQEPAQALPQADLVMLAVPDALIGQIAATVLPQLRSGAVLIMLDAAAAYVGAVPVREDVTLMLAHPCHPGLFVEQATAEARRDYFGGIGVQDVVAALMSGDRGRFEQGIALCRDVFAPVGSVHEVTVEQMALLEPAMSEVMVAAAACAMKEALEAVIAEGVPRAAAEAFCAGHVQIALAIAFGAEKAPFSDAAKKAVKWGQDRIFRPDWKDVLTPAGTREAIAVMLPEVAFQVNPHGRKV